jgi:hypothetical protein
MAMNEQIIKSRFIKNVRSLRRDISIVFLISFSSILLINFWLINIPELFKGGEKLGQIVYGLSFAYVSAFIFYFLVVHIKNQNDKENLYSYISEKTRTVIAQAKSLISESAKIAKIELKDSYPDESELKTICEAINIYSNAPCVTYDRGIVYLEWMQYFDLFRTRSNDATNKILSKLQFLDSELVYKVAKIEDCSFFVQISLYHSIPLNRDVNLTVFEYSLSQYFDLVKDLEIYYNMKLRYFK